MENQNARVTSNPEVSEKAHRRRFGAKYKLKILQDVDACSEGEIGALLRREGLYSSHLITWRRQRDEGALSALEPKKRGRKTTVPNPLAKENEKLRREIGRLQHRLERAEAIIEVQKKISALLGIPGQSDDESERNG